MSIDDLMNLVRDCEKYANGDEEFHAIARNRIEDAIKKIIADRFSAPFPIPIVIHCPECGERHIDEGEFKSKPHHTHSCQSCGLTWRPAIVDTVGVRFLPGFKN